VVSIGVVWCVRLRERRLHEGCGEGRDADLNHLKKEKSRGNEKLIKGEIAKSIQRLFI
jgi:hypothetical protein